MQAFLVEVHKFYELGRIYFKCVLFKWMVQDRFTISKCHLNGYTWVRYLAENDLQILALTGGKHE